MLTMALRRDRWCPRWRRLLHPWDFQRRWFRELSAFYRHLSPQEFWMNYRDLRAEAEQLWRTVPESEVYAKTDYFIYRQMYYHRDRCFHTISALVPHEGTLLEYGCGVAPVAAWFRRYRPDVIVELYDIPSRTLHFATWRLPGISTTFQMRPYDVIACLEVLEHVPTPLKTAEQLVDLLAPDGFLVTNFVAGDDGGGNLEMAQAYRNSTLDYLAYVLETLVPMTPTGGTGIYRRRDESSGT